MLMPSWTIQVFIKFPSKGGSLLMKSFEGLLKRSIKIPVQCSRNLWESFYHLQTHPMVAPFSFLLIYLLRSDWIPFLFKLKSPRVITEQDFHLIKLQTTRESQTKVNAHLCSLKWEPQLRSGDSEQINPNLDQNLRFGGSGLSCFTQQAKGGFSALEIWIHPNQILQMLWKFCPSEVPASPRSEMPLLL